MPNAVRIYPSLHHYRRCRYLRASPDITMTAKIIQREEDGSGDDDVDAVAADDDGLMHGVLGHVRVYPPDNLLTWVHVLCTLIDV